MSQQQGIKMPCGKLMVVSWRARAFETGTNDSMCYRSLPLQDAGQQSHSIRSCIHLQESSRAWSQSQGPFHHSSHAGAMHFHSAELLCSSLQPCPRSSSALLSNQGRCNPKNQQRAAQPSTDHIGQVLSFSAQLHPAGAGGRCPGRAAPSAG